MSKRAQEAAEAAAKKAKKEAKDAAVTTKSESEKTRNAVKDAKDKVGGDPDKTAVLPKKSTDDKAKTEADAKKAAAAKAKAEADAKAKADAERRAAEEKAKAARARKSLAEKAFGDLDEEGLKQVRECLKDFGRLVAENSDLEADDKRIGLIRQTVLGAILELLDRGLTAEKITEAIGKMTTIGGILDNARHHVDDLDIAMREFEGALSIMDSLH